MGRWQREVKHNEHRAKKSDIRAGSTWIISSQTFYQGAISLELCLSKPIASRRHKLVRRGTTTTTTTSTESVIRVSKDMAHSSHPALPRGCWYPTFCILEVALIALMASVMVIMVAWYGVAWHQSNIDALHRLRYPGHGNVKQTHILKYPYFLSNFQITTWCTMYCLVTEKNLSTN